VSVLVLLSSYLVEKGVRDLVLGFGLCLVRAYGFGLYGLGLIRFAHLLYG